MAVFHRSWGTLGVRFLTVRWGQFRLGGVMVNIEGIGGLGAGPIMN